MQDSNANTENPIDEFEEGFNLVEPESPDEPDRPEQDTPPEPPTPEAQPSPESAPQPQEAPPSPQPEQQPSLPQASIDEAIHAELADLEKLSPRAAMLAREDSPEGESLRRRLAVYGADYALDRAELILERRERAQRTEEQAIEAHNRQFQSVIRTDHPELFDTARTPQQNQQFMDGMKAWIGTKPYSEAKDMMEIFERGRDPRQVSALISRFKQESVQPQGRKAPDPAAIMAVPGRGAPAVPKDAGSKDDFDAGWNL